MIFSRFKTACIIILSVIVIVLYFYASRTPYRVIQNLYSPIVVTSQPQYQPESKIDFDNQKRLFDADKVGRVESLKSASTANRIAHFLMYIVPQLSCPTMVRIGAVGDGGKWVCNPWRVPERDCVIYSFGVNGDTSFETKMFEATQRRCKFYCVDTGPQGPHLFTAFNGTFVQKFIAAATDEQQNRISLLDFMKKFNHAKVDILKIDIEDWEYETLDAFFASTIITDQKTIICQVMIEMHFNPRTNTLLHKWFGLLESMEKHGFRMYSKEANTHCVTCFEFSYIHLSCFQQYGLIGGTTYFTYFL